MDRGAGPPKAERIGPYAIHAQIAAGGMARVHLGRRMGPLGFSRTVAIKRLHPQFVKDTDFVAMLVDEARIASRIAHPNVGAVLDIVAAGDEVLLVFEYIRGESLARLLALSAERQQKVPLRIACAVMAGVLRGLHAAHETRAPSGEPLGVIHRDVTPQNVLVGADGLARVVDFGIAWANGRSHLTPAGQVKGKLAYMAPEQLRDGPVDRRADVYAAAAVMWEVIAGHACFLGSSDGATVTRVLEGAAEAPSRWDASIPPAIDAIVMRGLALQPDDRFESAREMAIAIERDAGVAPPSEVGDWVETLASASLAQRDELVREMEPHEALEIVVDEAGPVQPAGTRRLSVRPSFAVTAESHGSSRPSVVSLQPPGAVRKSRGRWALVGLGAAVAIGVGIEAIPRPSRPVVWATPLDPASPSAATQAPSSHVEATRGPVDEPPGSAAADASIRPPAPRVASHDETSAPSSHSSLKNPVSRPSPSTAQALSPAPTPAPPTTPDCRVPYTVDAMKIKHFKIECL
jgi:serine/threonine-protein kinase